MFRFVARGIRNSGGGRRTSQGPTVTVKVDSGVTKAVDSNPVHQFKKERIVRPLSEEEENYELSRVRKNAGSNLRLKGKQSIQTNRKQMHNASYDQY